MQLLFFKTLLRMVLTPPPPPVLCRFKDLPPRLRELVSLSCLMGNHKQEPNAPSTGVPAPASRRCSRRSRLVTQSGPSAFLIQQGWGCWGKGTSEGGWDRGGGSRGLRTERIRAAGARLRRGGGGVQRPLSGTPQCRGEERKASRGAAQPGKGEKRPFPPTITASLTEEPSSSCFSAATCQQAKLALKINRLGVHFNSKAPTAENVTAV